MGTKIHPYLLARLLSVQEAFNKIEFHLSMLKKDVSAESPPTTTNVETDSSSGGGGGGGTARGLRGKNSALANAMRKLTRNR